MIYISLISTQLRREKKAEEIFPRDYSLQASLGVVAPPYATPPLYASKVLARSTKSDETIEQGTPGESPRDNSTRVSAHVQSFPMVSRGCPKPAHVKKVPPAAGLVNRMSFTRP
ncbi:hypothetical protein AAMO2058_001538700 [Amorphochlora amoebiformis]